MPLGKNALDLYMEYTNLLLREIKTVNNPEEIRYLTTIIDMRKNFLEILFLICMKLKKMDKLHSDIKQGFINSYMAETVKGQELPFSSQKSKGATKIFSSYFLSTILSQILVFM